ncbi:DNA polymerase III subunit gamma/tau [Microbacterium sp. GXF7504]
MARRDDDALSWGDDDPTLDVGDDGVEWDDEPAAPAPAAPAPAASGMVTARVTGPDGVVRTREVLHPHADDRGRTRTRAAADPDAPLGSVALVTLGVLGGIYALFALGWFLSGSRFQVWGLLFVQPAGYVAAWILATAAPIAWFVSVLVLARRRAVWQRVLLLVAGMIVLVPWPFLMTGVGA